MEEKQGQVELEGSIWSPFWLNNDKKLTPNFYLRAEWLGHVLKNFRLLPKVNLCNQKAVME